MHCIRIMTMAIEIAEGKGMILDRSETGDRDFLLNIKNHKKSYEEVMGYVEELEKRMNIAFENSTLPEEPDIEELNNILIKIRKNFYKI